MTATVAPMSAASKKRSNRQISEFSCRQVKRFVLKAPSDDYQLREKNTVVRYVNDGNLRVITVFLFDEEILRLTLIDKRALTLTVSFTSFLDCYGQPSTTTSERLNGLLDCLGWLGVIPQGVRLFRGDYNTTYFGRGDEKVAVGRGLVRSIYITPDSEKLKFAGYSTEVTPGGGDQ